MDFHRNYASSVSQVEFDERYCQLSQGKTLAKQAQTTGQDFAIADRGLELNA